MQSIFSLHLTTLEISCMENIAKTDILERENEFTKLTVSQEKLTYYSKSKFIRRMFSSVEKESQNTIFLRDIKSIYIVSTKFVYTTLYILGVIFLIAAFMSNEQGFTKDMTKLSTPATAAQIIAGIVLAIACFIGGNKFKKSKLGKIKILTTTHVDGKGRRTALFASIDEKELNDLKYQIESRCYQ